VVAFICPLALASKLVSRLLAVLVAAPAAKIRPFLQAVPPRVDVV